MSSRVLTSFNHVVCMFWFGFRLGLKRSLDVFMTGSVKVCQALRAHYALNLGLSINANWHCQKHKTPCPNYLRYSEQISKFIITFKKHPFDNTTGGIITRFKGIKVILIRQFKLHGVRVGSTSYFSI